MGYQMDIRTTALSNLGVIRASGADARNFLHTQLTQDVLNLNESETKLAGYCSAKGRLYGIFQIFADGETVYLITRREVIEPIIKRLRMFVLRAKVVFEEAPLQVQGVCAANALANQICVKTDDGFRLGVLPATIDGMVWPRELRVSPAVTGADSADTWDWLEVMAGQPHVELSTYEAFVPQMVNLDRIGGVNFKKGCYPGQEVVARSHYLGKLKRRMQMARGVGQVNVGADVYSSLDASQPAGQVVGAATHDGGTYILYEISLPLLADDAQVSVAGAVGEWQRLALPYALSDD